MSWKIFFTTFQFTCDLFDALNQDFNKSFDFYWLRDFSKVYINGPGHMAKMATMPIYGKNL